MKNPNSHNRLSKETPITYNALVNPNTHNRVVAGSNPAEPIFLLR